VRAFGDPGAGRDELVGDLMAKYRGLPTPFIQNVLSSLRQASDPGMVALADKVDYWLSQVSVEIEGMLAIHRPEQAAFVVLQELGYMVGADIIFGDSEDEMRKKIYAAIAAQKNKSLWTEDAKPKVDLIAGGDSKLWGDPYVDDWILCGGVPDATEPTFSYWASLGYDGIDLALGIWMIGDGTEVVIAGNIYIDVDNAALTAAQVQEIVDALLRDVVPAYMLIHLGYVTGGAFTEYTVV
jgi:hypothetical protein